MTPLFVCWMQGFGEGDGLVVGALIAGAFSLVLQAYVGYTAWASQRRDQAFRTVLEAAIVEDRKQFELEQTKAHQAFEENLRREMARIEHAQAERNQRRQHEMDHVLERFKIELNVWKELAPQVIGRVQGVRTSLIRACGDMKLLAFSSHTWDDQEMLEHSVTVLQSLSALFARPAAGTPDLPAELRPAFAEVRSAAARLFLAFHVVKDLRGKEQTMAEIKLSWDALEIVRDAFLLQADRFEQNAYRWHGSPPFSPEPMPGSPFYVLPENGMPASAEQRQ